MGSITNLIEVAHQMWRSNCLCRIHIGKSDFSRAYRSCPIASDHLMFSRCIVNINGSLYTSQQFAMPFGAVSAVYAWDRVGEAIVAILRRSFLLPVDRYVDDLFWIDWEPISSESRALLLELVHLIGFTLDPEKSDIPAPKMDILGAHVSIIHGPARLQVHTSVDQAKAQFWISELASLHIHEASGRIFERIAGKFAFACFAAYGRSARSKLNHISGISFFR